MTLPTQFEDAGSESTYSIGAAAREAGLSVHTLRYYEAIGLTPGVERNASGHRRYTQAQVRWLRFLDRLRATGMPIHRLKEYVGLAIDGTRTLEERHRLLQVHRVDLESQMEALQRCLHTLEQKIQFFRDGVLPVGSDSPESACVAVAPCAAAAATN